MICINNWVSLCGCVSTCNFLNTIFHGSVGGDGGLAPLTCSNTEGLGMQVFTEVAEVIERQRPVLSRFGSS